MTNELIVQPITFKDYVAIAVVHGMVASGYRDVDSLAKDAFDIADALARERDMRNRVKSRYARNK